MSRKSREDQSTWKMPTLYAFVGEYGPFKIKGYEPIENTLIWLCNSQIKDAEDDGRHDMYSLAGPIQKELLFGSSRYSSVLVMDIASMFENKEEYDDAIAKEIEELELTKKFGKLLLRLFQRLLLNQVVVAAQGTLCAVLLKLYQATVRIDGSHVDKMISELWLLQVLLLLRIHFHFDESLFAFCHLLRLFSWRASEKEKM